MICKETVKKNELIRMIIDDLSEKAKIVYLTKYFDEYNYYDLLPLLGLKPINYEHISD